MAKIYLVGGVSQCILDIFQFLRRDMWIFFRATLHNTPPHEEPNNDGSAWNSGPFGYNEQ
jgi:hypothetical protein